LSKGAQPLTPRSSEAPRSGSTALPHPEHLHDLVAQVVDHFHRDPVLLLQSRWIQRSLFPLAVILQVMPIAAIAPLLLIWIEDVRLALVLCAGIVAFFPVVANTTLGLNSADHNLLDLLRLALQVFRRVRLPSALP
jgi:predicted lysophospholipase L1 biosynthesis ABC-type transport system permease subunit